MSQVNPELERAKGEIASVCDLAIFSSLPNVTYISGFEIPQPIGAFAAATYAPPFAVVNVKDNASWLVVSVYSLAAAKRHAHWQLERYRESARRPTATESKR